MHKNNGVVLIILDGWGIGDDYDGNAISRAKTPFFDYLLQNFPATAIEASGEAVGLPEGQMGTSEVNHMTIGAGKVLYQDLVRINKAIKDETFFNNPAFLKAFEHVKRNNSTLHIKGLMSNGGVHSHEDHMLALLTAAKKHGVQKVYLHVFTDGRDVKPKSALTYLKHLQDHIEKLKLGKIASIAGRYYAMDRDQNWDRTNKAFDVLVKGSPVKYKSAIDAIKASYQQGITDEYIEPTSIELEPGEEGTITSHDAVIFVNFRNDRTRQLTEKFLHNKNLQNLCYTTMTVYHPNYQVEVAYPLEDAGSTLGEELSKAGIKQLRVTETEKFAHLTFFMNCKREEAYEGEDRMMFDSNSDIKTHDEKPEMRTKDIAAHLVSAIKTHSHQAIFANLCNADMVGHTGNIKAAQKGIETIDQALKNIVEAALAEKYVTIITADHGNAEEMKDKETGEPLSAHTTNLVPLILVGEGYNKLSHVGGSLIDIAPTILTLLNLPTPKDMTGKSFV